VDLSLAAYNINYETLGGFGTGKVMRIADSFINMSYENGSIMRSFWGGILIQTGGRRVLRISFGALNILTAYFVWFFSGEGVSRKTKASIDTDDLITQLEQKAEVSKCITRRLAGY
jgi:hypothetical protein